MAYTLQLDDPSLLLLTLIIALALISRSQLFSPQPAAHPLVFARQGEPTPTRTRGKSPVYRHWSGGGGVRPEKGLMGVKEVLEARGGKVVVGGEEVDLWTRSGRLYTGLNKLASSAVNGSIPIITYLPTPTTKETLLPTLLLNLVPAHGTETPYHLVTLTSPEHLAVAFRAQGDVPLVYTRARDVPAVLDAKAGDGGWIVMPSSQGITPELESRARERGWRLITLNEVVASAAMEEKKSDDPSDPAAVHSIVYISDADGAPRRRTLTNQNITASLVALLALFPASAKPSKRHIVVTSVDLAQPVGLAIVLLAIYAGKGVRWLDTEEPIDRAVDIAQDEECIAFLSTQQLKALTQRIVESAARHPVYPLVRQRKEAALHEGSISHAGWLERLVFAGKRGWADRLEAVVLVDGGPTVLSAAELSQALVHLAVPIVRTYAPRESASPVCATLFHDLQVVPFGGGAGRMHVGPPAVGCEVELRGEGVDVLEDGGDPRGTMYVRGPALLGDTSQTAGDGWTCLGREAVVRSNGTFVVL